VWEVSGKFRYESVHQVRMFGWESSEEDIKWLLEIRCCVILECQVCVGDDRI